MTFDIPHMIATGVIVFAAIWLVDHTNAFENMTKGRRTLFKFVGIFVAIIILNIVWPYGSGV
jgi:hypothetical protein